MEIRDNRAKEWFWLDNEYLNGYAKYLGSTCTVVYLSLCRHADNDTQTCFPSMKLIAEENGISTKTVERAIKKLEEWAIIFVERSKKEDGTQQNNIYTLLSKKKWKPKPTDIKSYGSDRQNRLPTDKYDKNRQTPVLYNKTHINKTQHSGINPQGIPLVVKRNSKMKNTWKQQENKHSDYLDDVIDAETGEFAKPKESKRQLAINYIKNYFSDLAEKKIGIRPIMGKKENIIIANLYNKGMKPSELESVINWWFATQNDKGKAINLANCLSMYSINLYRISK